MGRRGNIENEISDLESAIREYERFINDISDNIAILSDSNELYNQDITRSLSKFDITQGDYLQGNEISTAISFQEDCHILSINVEGRVGNLIDELNAIIQRYEEMIEECRSKINSLLDELNSISEETFE